MNVRSIWAVMPVKSFAVAKQRLMPLLSSGERAEFARLMLEDVFEALAACKGLAGAVMITGDDAARRMARAYGAVVVGDDSLDLNAAVRRGREFVREPGAGMIVVPSDIPLLPSSVIEQLIGGLSQHRSVALVPATRDGGTNLLACCPVDAIDPCFGPDSFQRHCAAAGSAGIAPAVISSEQAGLDIDRPEDLAAFVAVESETRSRAFLSGLDIAARLQSDAQRPTVEA
jgi:2-phospho-L-lactate/phosphoenolpyruvate guanylyltransferase